MCDPVSMSVLAIASAGAGAYSQHKAANAQVDAANEQAEAQAEEMTAQRDQQIGQRVEAARAERARMRVAAGEAGVSGASFEAQLRHSLGSVNQDVAVAKKQSSFNTRAINANLKSNTASTKGVNALSSGLQIASAGASGYSAGLDIKAKRKR